EGVAVVVEKRRIRRPAPIVRILRPRQRRLERPKNRDERPRPCLHHAIPEPADRQSLGRNRAIRPAARRIDRPHERDEFAKRGGGTLVTCSRSGSDQRFVDCGQEPSQQSRPLEWSRMRYALPHARPPPPPGALAL